MSSAPSQQILVVAPAWVGDMVMAQALLIALARRDPAAAIDVLAPASTAPLAARMPEVRRCIVLPLGHGELGIGLRWRTARRLARSGYDRAIVTPNSWKSALVPALAGIPRRTGWRGEQRYGLLNDLRVLDRRRYPRMVERFVALAAAGPLPTSLPRPRLRADREHAVVLAERFGIDPARPLLALCPGAEFGEAKRWPPEHFAAVAEHGIRAGWQVAVFGSTGDIDSARALHAALPAPQRAHCLQLAGRTTLVEAVDAISLAAAVVSNDSGLMHIAAALDRPLVAVYGSTSPDFTPPLCDTVRIVAETLACRPCFQRTCPLGHLRCLRDLAPARVIAALESIAPSAGADTPPGR